MTNVEGLELLFVALGLFGASVVAAGVLGAIIGWMRWGPGIHGRVAVRLATAATALGIAIALVSWGYAVVFVTPAGLVDRLADLNPVLIVLLVGYTLPAVLAVYLLSELRAEGAGSPAA